MSINSASASLRKLGVSMLAAMLATAGLSACSTVEKGWKSTKDAVTGLFSDDDEAPSADASGGGAAAGSPANAPPSLSSVPSAVPKPPSTTDERKRVVEGLIADRARAEYTDQGGRQEPVTVRPLTETASTPADVAARGAPPRPQAAPTESVTRLAEAPSPPAEPVPPRTTALAERLGAAPPPAPPAEMPSAAMPAPPAAVTPPAPSSITYAPTMATPVRPLIPALGQIASYGDETIVVDSSGVRGGSRVLAPSQQVAGLPRAGFDPGNASVSSEVGRISFAPGSTTLSAEAKAMLADIARLRAQVDGALRIVGRGDQAAARAAAISRELRRLGVPAARLYDGGADGTLLGDEADIYLDY